MFGKLASHFGFTFHIMLSVQSLATSSSPSSSLPSPLSILFQFPPFPTAPLPSFPHHTADVYSKRSSINRPVLRLQVSLTSLSHSWSTLNLGHSVKVKNLQLTHLISNPPSLPSPPSGEARDTHQTRHTDNKRSLRVQKVNSQKTCSIRSPIWYISITLTSIYAL